MRKFLAISIFLTLPLLADDRSKDPLSATHTDLFYYRGAVLRCFYRARIELSWPEWKFDGIRRSLSIRSNAPELAMEIEVLQGSPKQMIVEEAARWGSDLIILGSHGHGPVHRFLLGSVSAGRGFSRSLLGRSGAQATKRPGR